MPAVIVVVEDNPVNLELVSYLLRSAGHDTRLARDGVEALAMALASPPDLILTDLEMPEMDGFALLRRVLAEPTLAHVPVVALTAFSMSSDRTKALAAGFTGYISKPIEPETFIATVDSFLSPDLRSRPAAP